MTDIWPGDPTRLLSTDTSGRKREGAEAASIVHDLPEDSAEHGLDTAHEEAGAAWLERHFVPRVTEPLRLHVLAKRYLCATEPAYLAELSPASLLSLGLQGGPCSPTEVAAFERGEFAEETVRLRRWDDKGKIPGLSTPPLEHYRAALQAGLRSNDAQA